MKPIVGSIVALVTPMLDDGSVDYVSIRSLIDWHIEQGTDCVSVVGTTGESPVVNVKEHCEIIRVAVEHAAGRIPIMAGCGANSTAEAINLAKFAREVGANCQLQVVPYYNKPTQEGIYQHFKQIVEKTGADLPVILYNVPGRTAVDMLPDTSLRLAELEGVVGIKEASGNIDRSAYLIKHRPKSFHVYSGDDPTAIATMLLGGHGNISVTANIAPKLMHDMCMAAIAGDAKKAQQLHFELMSLNQVLFIESNPIPVKWALARMGKIKPHIRLPLTPLSKESIAKVEKAISNAGLLA